MTMNEEGKVFNKIIHMQSCLGIGYDKSIKECNKCKFENKCKMMMQSEESKMLFQKANILNPFSKMLLKGYDRVS